MSKAIDNIFPISAFKDNYIWLYYDPASRDAFVVDPGLASPVSAVLKKNNFKLTTILLTHHHHDHSGGIADLLLEWKDVVVYGSETSVIKHISHPVKQGDKIQFHTLNLSVMGIPGHTLDHLAYYNDDVLFSGDTLFSAGCGRLFEGSPQMMYDSLAKLKKLPVETAIFCGHEYTLSNLYFAEQVEPNNIQIKEMIRMVLERQLHHKPSLPSTVQIEHTVNPFFRCDHPDVRRAAEEHAQKPLHNGLEVFTVLREWKNNYTY